MRLRGSGVGNSLPFPRGEGTGGVQVAVNRGHRYPQLLCNLGHGARPDLTNDPIKAACDLALQLSSIPSNYYDVLDHSVVSIGMTAIISVINLVIPSATSKAAILVPIIKPIAETLQMDLDLAVQAFQYGDGFTNIVSPFLGWTIGSCAMAGVPYPTWLKWALPKVICFIVIGFVIMYALTELGWTAF